MGAGQSLRLDLSETAWVQIDGLASRIRGNTASVIQTMQSALNQPEMVTLCDRLGICSAGFLFLNHFKRMTRFYKPGEEAPQTYQTPYISQQKELSQQAFRELHDIFVCVRAQTYEWLNAEDSLAPEYFRYLPSFDPITDGALVQDEQSLRTKYGIHYCSYGEIVVTTFLWRALSILSYNGRGDEDLDTALPLNLDFGIGLDVTRAGLLDGAMIRGHPKVSASPTLYRLWLDRIGKPKIWREEWRALGLGHPTITVSAAARLAGLRFCRAFQPRGSRVCQTDEEVNASFFSILRPLISALHPQPVRTVNDALDALSSSARFPILPFFIWNGLDDQAKVYSVIPIWSSQSNPLEHAERTYYDFGLALTALRPLTAIDWTIKGSPPSRAAFRSTDPLILTSLLRLAARPLVEGSLYEPLMREAQAKMDDETSGIVKTLFGGASGI